MLWKGRVLFGMMLFDEWQAFRWLAEHPLVDPDRIGVFGMSMGATKAWWLAALEPRVACCMDLCCLTDFDTLVEEKGLGGHGIYYYVPGLLKHFDTSAINALIAPRPHLALAGLLDPLTPPRGLDKIDARLQQVYASLDAADNWQLLRYTTGHFETADGRAQVLRFLRAHLG